METIVFNLEPCKEPRRYRIKAENITSGRGGLLAENLTKSKADSMFNAYQSGALLAGAKVSGQKRYK